MEPSAQTPNRESSMGQAFFVLIAHALPLLAVCWALLFAVPKFREIFKSFDTELPALTVFVLGLSRIASVYFFVLAPVVPALLAADVFIFCGLRRSGHGALAWTWGGVVFGLELLAIGIVQIAMFQPLVDLMEFGRASCWVRV